mgnify:CR=1 FL=1
MEWTLSYAYLADPVHNPSRKLIWTQPYSAIWLNSNVVTALMPIDIRGMFFGHFGADVQSRCWCIRYIVMLTVI